MMKYVYFFSTVEYAYSLNSVGSMSILFWRKFEYLIMPHILVITHVFETIIVHWNTQKSSTMIEDAYLLTNYLYY